MNQPRRRVAPLRQVKTYHRPMAGWYMHGRNTYKRYMVRELTSVAVAYYALLVLYGLFQLHAGPEAFDGFIASLRSPLWMIINLATLALVTYHAITWFLVMPKTAPLHQAPARTRQADRQWRAGRLCRCQHRPARALPADGALITPRAERPFTSPRQQTGS